MYIMGYINYLYINIIVFQFYINIYINKNIYNVSIFYKYKIYIHKHEKIQFLIIDKRMVFLEDI